MFRLILFKTAADEREGSRAPPGRHAADPALAWQAPRAAPHCASLTLPNIAAGRTEPGGARSSTWRKILSGSPVMPTCFTCGARAASAQTGAMRARPAGQILRIIVDLEGHSYLALRLEPRQRRQRLAHLRFVRVFAQTLNSRQNKTPR